MVLLQQMILLTGFQFEHIAVPSKYFLIYLPSCNYYLVRSFHSLPTKFASFLFCNTFSYVLMCLLPLVDYTSQDIRVCMYVCMCRLQQFRQFLYVCDVESRAKRQTSCDTAGRSVCTLLLVADFRFYQNMGLGSIAKTTSYLV